MSVRPDKSADLRASPLFVQSLEKAFEIIEAFNTPMQFLGLVDIAAATGFDKSTTQRFVHTLHALGYLERDPITRRYALSRRVLGIAFSFLRANPLVARATPTLIDLRRTTQERVGLSLWDDLHLIYAVRLQSKRETFFATLIGRRMPVYCTSGGRAILSKIGQDEALSVLERSDRQPQTVRTLTDPAAIMRKVEQARRKGYAVNVEEALPGEITVSAAVLGDRGRPEGAVHISGSIAEWDPEEFEREMAASLVEAATAISY